MLSEWHLTPEYVNTHWTDEILASMVQARRDRLRGSEHPPVEQEQPTPSKMLSDAELFKRMNIKVTKR